MQDVETFRLWDILRNSYEVGGGKTVVSTVVSLMAGHNLTIVAVPPILITPWGRWLRKVSERVVEYRGLPKKRKALDLASARWIIVSHALLRQDFDTLNPLFQLRAGQLAPDGRPGAQLVVDEAHYVKNVASILYQRVRDMTQEQSLQMLTGTPISKPLDAYAYISLSQPKLYRSYKQAHNLYVAAEDHFGKITAYQDLGKLAEHFALQSITRTKLELHGYNNPPNYPDSAYTLSDDHYRLYEKLVEEQLLQFEDGTKIDASTANKLRHALQQIVVNYDHFSNGPSKKSAAFDLLDLTVEQTECEQVGKSKLIVWTNYKMSSGKVWKYLLDKGIYTTAAYSGSNSEKAVEAFMTDPKCRILVAHYQSAGMGLNPQELCWESLFLELTTVPIYMRQALGRIDRTGQLHIPTQRLAFATGTTQAAMLERLLTNDENAVEVDITKEALRKSLLGR